MAEQRHPSIVRLVAGMAVFVILAVPMFAYLWWTLNELFSGFFDPVRGGIAVVVLIAFILLLLILVRSIKRWEAEREADVAAHPTNRR